MKLRGAKAVHYDSGPNMTPLVDVVMVILIFLMLTGSFGAASSFLPSTMPIKEKGKGKIDPSKIPKVPDPQLEIMVFTAGDGFRATISGVEYTTSESLVAALVEKRKKHEATGSTADQMQVILSPRLKTRWSTIVRVYDAALKAEWPKIGFQSAKS